MIRDAIRQAQRMHRKVVEDIYDGICNIYGMKSEKNPQTKVTTSKEIILIERQPCHLTFSSFPPATESETSTTVSQYIKLLLAPEILIEPGSRIEVTQQGRTESYKRSGKPAVYASHQELTLILWERA